VVTGPPSSGTQQPGPILVQHSRGSYPLIISPGSLQYLVDFTQDRLAGRRLAMIADATVQTLYAAGRWGRPVWTGETLTVPPGEESKNRETWARLTDDLLLRHFGRDSGLLGLGGGVVGDLTGFVAATYLRGVPYLLIPTTLLAMLDASIGGKTGVNAPLGKNLIGAFHPPVGVLADPLVLLTLPEREYRGGLAEAVKHGAIADSEYFEWLEARADAILARDPPTTTQLVRRSVEIKAAVVSEDEQEGGRRAILNAGHTIGHALEQGSSYELSHGEAVALGLVAECALAERIGVAGAGLRQRVEALLGRFGLPVRLRSAPDSAALVEVMRSDKKNRNRQVHFALIASVGRMHQHTGWTTAPSEGDIRAALSSLGPSD
jgi:3-dehydroquinate synthase